ncbi:MAG: type II CAAX prenyl endopeptidase Rce1 family protein [Syntrophothermus sp.]
MHRKQLTIFVILLLVYALCAFASYAFFANQAAAAVGLPMPDMGVSNVVLGLANAGIILVVYGLAGLAGYWFAHKLGLPGIYSEEGNLRRWVLIPLLLGLIVGVAMSVVDLVFAPFNGFGHMVHPGFPYSIISSLAAGIGEEIMFRGFVFGLWVFLLNWLFKRFNGRTAALWMANVIAALAFGAGHIGTIMLLTGVSSPSQINPILLAETFLLNAMIGLTAGERYMKDGLVAASGVHFWADMVFHVVYGLL